MSSKKLKRLILILVVVLLFATGGYLIADYFISLKEDAVTQEKASLQLYSFNPNSIDTVNLSTEEGNFKMEIVDSEWALTETDYPHDITLNTAYVSIVCSYMSELTAETKFQNDDAHLADYGLDDPVVLTCSGGGAEYTVYVGNATPTQEYFYVMVPDNDTVYGISYDRGIYLYGDTDYLKSPYMLNYLDVEIAEIAFERDGELIFDFVTKDNAWVMEGPMKNAAISPAQVSSLVTALVRLQLNSFVGLVSEGVDPVQYGLDDPYATLTVKGHDGKTTIIDVAPYDVNDGIIYLLYRNEQEVATIMHSTMGFLNTDISEFLNEKIHPVDFYSVASVDAVVDDITFRMEIDAQNNAYRFDGQDINGMGSEVFETFNALFNTMSNLTFEELQLDADVDVTAEPAAVFHYTMADGTESELSLIAADDSLYYAIVDGEYTGMTVRRRSLSGSTGILMFHERMMDLMTEAQESNS